MKNLLYLFIPCVTLISCDHHDNNATCTCTIDVGFGVDPYESVTHCIDCTDDQYTAFVNTCTENDLISNYSCVLQDN